MTTERNVVIVRQPMTNLVGSMKFWTGKRWSFEYPNAKVYTATVAKRIAAQFDGDCQLVADYGLESQTNL